MARIDIDRLRIEIRRMTPRSRLYQMIKDELTDLGHWRNHPRGNPSAGFRTMKLNQDK